MAHIVSTRRDLLRGLGLGAVAFSPFARSVQAAAAGRKTGNFMVFYTPNGHVRSAFGATGAGASFALKPSLAPLEPFKSKLAVLERLDNPGASSKASHEDCVRTLTCVPGGDIYKAYGPSIDWVVANHLGSRPLTMSSVWSASPNWQTKISWRASGVFDPHVDSASALFNEVFGRFVPPSAGDATKVLAQGKSVLDFVRQDLERLSPRLPPADRVKLQNHAEALRELETNLQATGGAACATGPVKTRVDASSGGATGGEELKRAIELKIDLAATAFACGARRVATLLTQGCSAGRNPFGGNNHHSVSHYEGKDPVVVWKRIDVWYAERFAYLLKRLADLQILDDTVVAWCTEIVEGHSQRGFVIPVAGGRALGLQQGASFSGGTLSNLWVSVGKALGVASDTFGVGASGGIPGLWKA
jgi:hypothetical protein